MSKFTLEEKQKFAAEYMAGSILKDLAKVAGVSIPTMAKYVRAGGGTLRPAGTVKPAPDAMKIVEQVNDILAQANPCAEIDVPVTLGPPVRKIMSFE